MYRLLRGHGDFEILSSERAGEIALAKPEEFQRLDSELSLARSILAKETISAIAIFSKDALRPKYILPAKYDAECGAMYAGWRFVFDYDRGCILAQFLEPVKPRLPLNGGSGEIILDLTDRSPRSKITQTIACESIEFEDGHTYAITTDNLTVELSPVSGGSPLECFGSSEVVKVEVTKVQGDQLFADVLSILSTYLERARNLNVPFRFEFEV